MRTIIGLALAMTIGSAVIGTLLSLFATIQAQLNAVL